MKIRVNNKKVLIVLLMLLMLILALGYAVFSEILTIQGTANAKGTFDLEFQNAEVVKNVGANKDNTTAQISEDRNTLTVNVVDLAYPGAGVEFSVDIVNVGTMPAEVRAVTPNNITGSDKIKVTGLGGIKVGHPKIEVGDKCNIHFTVEWPLEEGEIPEAESSISFGLQIEYAQAIGELFEGTPSHTDTDEGGNTIISNTTVPEEPLDNRLISKITAEDYGKSINYIATVKGQQITNWKVLYNDKNNIYLILDDFLENSLISETAKLSTYGMYGVNSEISRDTLLNGLATSSYWSEFANGIEGSEAKGGPTFEMLMSSYNEKYKVSFNTDSTKEGNFYIDRTDDKLYVSHTERYKEEINGYWFLSKTPDNANSLWLLNYLGFVHTFTEYSHTSGAGIRPIVKLPSTVEGTVGEETVKIK